VIDVGEAESSHHHALAILHPVEDHGTIPAIRLIGGDPHDFTAG
jgi:hypothetical protein